MKKLVKLFAFVLVFALSFTATKALEGDYDYSPGNEATGTTTQLDKYLVVEKDTMNPAITFTYSLTADGISSVSGDADKLPVYKGIGDTTAPTTGTPTVAAVAFTAGEARTDGGSVTGDKITDTNKWYAKKTITLDFTDVTYPKPGVYRYVLEEADSNSEAVGGVKYDVDVPDGSEKTRKRTIDVYVEDNEGTLSVTGYVAYDGVVTAAPDQEYDPAGYTGPKANGDENGTGVSGKKNYYINQILTNTMTAKKVVAGNQGDKESKWKIKVDFEDMPTGVKAYYALIEDNGTVVQNPTYAEYTSGTELSFDHNDKVKWIGIPEGAKYTVKETDENTLGYTTTYEKKEYTFANDGTVENKDDAVVTNTREGVIPTGVATAIKTGLVIVGLGAAGLFLTRKKEEDEE